MISNQIVIPTVCLINPVANLIVVYGVDEVPQLLHRLLKDEERESLFFRPLHFFSPAQKFGQSLLIHNQFSEAFSLLSITFSKRNNGQTLSILIQL